MIQMDTFFFSVVAVSSMISGLAALYLARLGWRTRTSRVAVAGLLPMALLIAVLFIGHIAWLQQRNLPQHEAYSPLVFFIFGFWMIPIILVANVTVSFLVGRSK